MAANLDDRVKDKISGLSGIVTGVTDFLYGCRRIGVTPEENNEGKPAEPFWIDDAQAKVVKKHVIAPFVQAVAPSPAGPRPDARRPADARR